MTPAERAREIEAVLRAVPWTCGTDHVYACPCKDAEDSDLNGRPDYPALAAAALAAQAAQLDDAQFAARAAQQTLTAYAAKYEQEAAQTRALRDAVEAYLNDFLPDEPCYHGPACPAPVMSCSECRMRLLRAALTGAPRESA